MISGGSVRRITHRNNVYFTTGQRGALKAVLHGFSFIRNKSSLNVGYFRCAQWRKSKCKAKFMMNPSKDEIVYKNIEHSHAPDCDHLTD